MRILLTFIIAIVSVTSSPAAAIESFDDIVLWTGNGANETALVIDFDGESTTDRSLTWGFRWDGDRTVEDMLLAVVADDSRLFTAVSASSGSFGRSLFGIGYDADGDGEFGIDNSAVRFDEDGIARLQPADGSGEGDVTDAGDLYRGGFLTGFWQLGESVGNPFGGGSWNPAPTGISGVITDDDFNPTGAISFLEDGDWASLAWNAGADGFDTPVFAVNPVAAIPEPNSFLAMGILVGVGSVCLRRRR